MCVNDVRQLGEPRFLDYLATGKLNPPEQRTRWLRVAKGCQLGAYWGGETAENGFHWVYDLLGFVGIVESQMLDGSQVQAGRRCHWLASQGVHSSNGFRLAEIVDGGFN